MHSQPVAPPFSASLTASANAGGRQLVSDMMRQLRESSLTLNGALLIISGFLGFFSALQLDLQRCILSVYVLFFGLLICAFSTGWNQLTLQRYFGFAYTPKGQLAFVLLAGNLAWCTGWVGWLVAAYTNVNAFQAWQRAVGGGAPFEYRGSSYGPAGI